MNSPDSKLSFGEFLRDLRIKKDLPLRKVAADLDIDPSTLGKIERNERNPNSDLIKRMSQIYSTDLSELKVKFLSEKICYEIFEEGLDEEVLRVAEQRIKYIKSKKIKQGNLTFNNL